MFQEYQSCLYILEGVGRVAVRSECAAEFCHSLQADCGCSVCSLLTVPACPSICVCVTWVMCGQGRECHHYLVEIEPVLTDVERDGGGGWFSLFAVIQIHPQYLQDSELVSTKSDLLQECRAWFLPASITS